MSQITTALTRLAATTNTASVNTVVQTNAAIDLSLYSASDLPLVEIKPSDIGEAPGYEVSRHALWEWNGELTCYFLDDIEDVAQREALAKELKDAIGGDPTLNDTCAEIRILQIIHGGEFPLWTITIGFVIVYEKGIANA